MIWGFSHIFGNTQEAPVGIVRGPLVFWLALSKESETEAIDAIVIRRFIAPHSPINQRANKLVYAKKKLLGDWSWETAQSWGEFL